jgi:hypothetical protein
MVSIASISIWAFRQAAFFMSSYFAKSKGAIAEISSGRRWLQKQSLNILKKNL